MQHNGQHLTNDQVTKQYIQDHPEHPICEDCFEFMQSWTHAGGAHAAIKEFVDDLRERSGAAFARGDDDRAKAYRVLAEVYEKEELKQAHAKLKFYLSARGLYG
jgi:hypothetical protein